MVEGFDSLHRRVDSLHQHTSLDIASVFVLDFFKAISKKYFATFNESDIDL